MTTKVKLRWHYFAKRCVNKVLGQHRCGVVRNLSKRTVKYACIREVCKKVGIGSSTIYQYRVGMRPVGPNTRQRIMDFIDVPGDKWSLLFKKARPRKKKPS